LLHVVLLDVPNGAVQNVSMLAWVVARDDAFDLGVTGLGALGGRVAATIDDRNGVGNTE